MKAKGKLDKLEFYKIIVSFLLGVISFIGIFYSIRIEFSGTSINFALSLMLPMLVALAWGWKYGFLSISLGLVFIYPFILGPYNGWASLVPSITLFIWIGLHGWGAISRKNVRTIWNNIYTLQLIHIVIKLILYLLLFQPLLKLDIPFWNTNIMENLGLDIIMIFAFKGVIVDSILLAICDSILLMPFIRKFFKLKIFRGSKYNTPALLSIVTFGMTFTLLIMFFNNLFISRIDIRTWVANPDAGTILTLSLSLLLFIVMAGITVRYLQKNQEARIILEKRNRQYLQVIEKINKMNADLENLVDKRTKELKFAVKEMEEFSFGVSHDLKSPIRAIDAYSQMLLEDNPEIDNKSKDMIESIKKHCNGMINLIDKILEYSLLSNKKVEIEYVDIAEVVGELITEYRIGYPERLINFSISGNSILVLGDKILIKDAIGNILSNAVKYTRNRDLAEINIELKLIGEENIVSITDNGIGFDIKHKDKIFNIFQRLHGNDEYEGSGIGLTLAKKIIANHNGKIEIDSIKEKGTKVDIIFPMISSSDKGVDEYDV
ncbi:MAG: integral membrane sensor signal transduction histidine kinase [Fusobacteria bacterium]|nr:MAG: integral membrane sensor signal transduction histidine kinase [Fusobacteriota bacterium]KAF0229650.1 MAG: integral membrane sensor signal transduction histidine [Fusobacteriota bacterium]